MPVRPSQAVDNAEHLNSFTALIVTFSDAKQGPQCDRQSLSTVVTLELTQHNFQTIWIMERRAVCNSATLLFNSSYLYVPFMLPFVSVILISLCHSPHSYVSLCLVIAIDAILLCFTAHFWHTFRKSFPPYRVTQKSDAICLISRVFEKPRLICCVTDLRQF